MCEVEDVDLEYLDRVLWSALTMERILPSLDRVSCASVEEQERILPNMHSIAHLSRGRRKILLNSDREIVPLRSREGEILPSSNRPSCSSV